MRSTRISRRINAPRAKVYRAFLDARAVATWMVPPGMTSYVHAFDAREGGSLRISLTYNEPSGTGKTTAHTDTYHGHFVKLVPDEQIVETVEFEATNPEMRGEMTITISFADAHDGGTDVLAVHDGLPPGVPLGQRDRLAPGARQAGDAGGGGLEDAQATRVSKRNHLGEEGRRTLLLDPLG